MDTCREGNGAVKFGQREMLNFNKASACPVGTSEAYVVHQSRPLVARLLYSCWDPLSLWTAQGTHDIELEADGWRLSADCIPHCWSYQPFLGGPGQRIFVPTTLGCRRRIMIGPTLCCCDIEISSAFSTQHTWYRVGPQYTFAVIAIGILGRVRLEEELPPFFNSSGAYVWTTPRVRHCSLTGSAGLRIRAVHRWPGQRSSRREHLSQGSKEARNKWCSHATALRRENA